MRRYGCADLREGCFGWATLKVISSLLTWSLLFSHLVFSLLERFMGVSGMGAIMEGMVGDMHAWDGLKTSQGHFLENFFLFSAYGRWG